MKDVGCSNCYEVGAGYIEVDSGKKVCRKCGGTCLTIQEAFDYIADLKVRLELSTDTEDYYE